MLRVSRTAYSEFGIFSSAHKPILYFLLTLSRMTDLGHHILPRTSVPLSREILARLLLRYPDIYCCSHWYCCTSDKLSDSQGNFHKYHCSVEANISEHTRIVNFMLDVVGQHRSYLNIMSMSWHSHGFPPAPKVSKMSNINNILKLRGKVIHSIPSNSKVARRFLRSKTASNTCQHA